MDDDVLLRAARLLGEGTRIVAIGWAAAHRESVSAFVRRATLAGRVGGGTDADEVWDSLPPKRKEQIARWLLGADPDATPIPGQGSILDAH
jgi:hypothetical protein